MSENTITRGLKGPRITFRPILAVVLALLLISLFGACASPATNTYSPDSNTSVTVTATPTTTTQAAKPQGELIAAVQSFGDEDFLPWMDPVFPHVYMLVFDMLIYWDYINNQFLPGLAESWEVSPDGLTTTYHLRRGVHFSDGWGELTSEDVKYTWGRQQTSPVGGKPTVVRRIASMDTPDPYTLIVHMKNPYHTFYVDMSLANSGVSQGIVCKKYLETVGDDVASQKPIGTGPYRLVESRQASYYKFEAMDSNWRVVPEFKYLTVRLIPETSTVVAALKTKEIDLSQIPVQQLKDLQSSGVAVELNPVGGSILNVSLGGMVIPEDTRYDAAYHNKDPWTDVRVRKAMSIAIDREAICKAIYSGFAEPAAVPLLTAASDNYQYPYDPAQARQLLKDAGYPDGFRFRVIASADSTAADGQRVAEALAGYWEQIGLDPKINIISHSTYYSSYVLRCKTAGDVWITPINSIADQLSKAELFFIPNVMNLVYQDAESYAIYRDNPKGTIEERSLLTDKLNQYYFDNYCPIPVVRNAYCFAWNSDKISPFIHDQGARPLFLEYVRHNPPLNTFRLFTLWPGR